VRVAVDGPDAAGKTTLADELASGLRNRGRVVIRASIDGFHRPRAERYRRGADAPEGYYEDSFDYGALRHALLDPLGPGGSRAYRRAVFDFRTDAPRSEPETVPPEDAVLLFDGVFLLRPELFESWDLRIFVSVGFDEALRRALDRDAALFGSRHEVERRYRSRYIPGQRLYLAGARPTETADLVVFNDDPARPVLTDRASAGPWSPRLVANAEVVPRREGAGSPRRRLTDS
jgi:uridine kinase